MKLYKALGLAHSPPPTPAAIKEAFVSISLISHPDRVKDLPATEQKAALQRFLKAKNAYEILKDKDKRREYDLRFNNLSPAAAAAP
ncbi:chaperone J-domain-containing protein, partial [Rhizoclosmatium globosum]